MSRGRHVPFPNVPQVMLAEAVTKKESGLEQMSGESEEAYRAFVQYCILGREGRFCDVADAVGKSRSMISSYRAQHHWGARIDDWWQQKQARERDGAAGQEPAKIEPSQRELRRDQLRSEEWDLHSELIEAGRIGLERWKASDKVPTLAEIAKAVDLASRLGRLATGLPLNYTEISGNPEKPIRIEIETALEQVYGADVVDIDSEVVDAQILEDPASIADHPGISAPNQSIDAGLGEDESPGPAIT
ncbi:MAG TPA: hypothetical protein VN673_01915 [Clostridia bacterium]|nr:hypothetical protein [Clostridia bacterium]